MKQLVKIVKLTLPRGIHEDSPWPGKSIANIGRFLLRIGARGSQVPALSCHPCKASIGCSFSSPHNLAATCPHVTGICISFTEAWKI